MSETLFDMPNDEKNFPLLPYGGTSGWSGTDTSRERAEADDSSGATAKRQRETLGYIQAQAIHGATVKELREWTGWHHGRASSALSTLHKEGRLVRLAERRDRCHVYVLPEWVVGREVQKYGRNRRGPEAQKLATIRALAAEWHNDYPCTYSPLCRHCAGARLAAIIDEENSDG